MKAIEMITSGFTQKPREVVKTGDDSAASSLLTYVRRMTGWHQVAVCTLAAFVALLNLAPIELQRRIVNEVVETRDVSVLVQFGIAYSVIILMHQAFKYALWLYQSWLTESTNRYTRAHLLTLYGDKSSSAEDGTGRAVSVVGAEVEKLGGFAGEALSGACANGAMLIGVAAYMLYVEPQIAVFALAFLIPQVVITPFLQRKLNVLIEERVVLLRDLGDGISGMKTNASSDPDHVVNSIFTNRMRFFVLKFAMKSALNLLNALGPLTVLLFGGYLAMQGDVQLGVIVAFISGFEKISSPLRELIGFYRITAQANVQHRMIAKWMAS